MTDNGRAFRHLPFKKFCDNPKMVRRGLIAGSVLAGAGLAVGSAGFAGRELLHRQAAIARDAIGKPLGEDPLDADRTYKGSYGHPIDLLVLGDSIAAGLGADSPKETFGARLAKRVAKRTRRSVRLRCVAVVGAESSMLASQLDGVPAGYRPDVAVVIVGGNDVTHRVSVAESAADLEDLITRLRERGAEVVVGTCPDLGALTPVPQPLRGLGSRLSRQLARAQAQATIATGGYAVCLADVVGPFFITNPEEMFSLDRFHPSPLGYKRTAKAIAPSVLAALGVSQDLPFGHRAPERTATF